VLVEADACHIKSEAILRIAKYLQQPFPALAKVLFPLPGMFRDLVYDKVSSMMPFFWLLQCFVYYQACIMIRWTFLQACDAVTHLEFLSHECRRIVCIC
jgi:predicted DCC family thiol-disulfide oxidoreductase YuxK